MKYLQTVLVRIFKLIILLIAICLYSIGSIIVFILFPLVWVFTGKIILNWWFIEIFNKLP